MTNQQKPALKLIDSHAHVAFYQFDTEREAVITRAREAGVAWLEIGTDLAQSRKAVELAARLDGIYATVGVHPSDVAGLSEMDWTAVEELLSHEKVVAIGEVGLDYHHQDNHEEQLVALQRFTDLASQKQLPVVFHVRDGKERNAHEDMVMFLEELREKRPPGVIHTFSGTTQQAEKYLELGFYLSISGVVTFKNAGEIAIVAKTMPADKMLVETDSPFLAPEPYRGKQNQPAYVKLVAEKIAELRGVDPQKIADATRENAKRLFKIHTPSYSPP